MIDELIILTCNVAFLPVPFPEENFCSLNAGLRICWHQRKIKREARKKNKKIAEIKLKFNFCEH